MKHFSIFNNVAEYNAEKPFLIRPQVALVKENEGVGFLGEYDENDTIYYKASDKLTETTSDKNAGLHTNAFNVSITSHTFANGIGVVKFAGEVTSIGNNAFYGCSGLTSVTIPNSVTSIGNYAFQHCYNLTSITIPASVTSIGNYAFQNCSGLTSVTIGNSVTSIGNYAFYDCSGLTSVTIPNSVSSIADAVFFGCSSLTSIIVESGNTKYDSRNNCNAIIETASNTLIAGCKNTIIPNSVTSIGNYAFQNCSSLTSITIPNSVTSIGSRAFEGCSITSITIPASVTSIGEMVFQNCSGLTNIKCNATTAPTIKSRTFLNIKSGGILTVPTGSTGYDVWMGTGNYYLGKYNWTKVEQ